MASLKQYATRVIDAINKPFDEMLYERVKDIIISERSLDIRRSVQKNGIDDEFKQRFKLAVSKVDKSDLYGVTTESTVFRTNNKIAKLVRFKNDNPFTYVGSVEHDRPFMYAQSFGVKGLDSLRYAKYTPKYSFNNGYIYLYIRGNALLENIAIESIFADPREIDYSDNATAPVPYEDTMEFLCSEDLIPNIITKILKGELSVTLTDDRETEITDEEIVR